MARKSALTAGGGRGGEDEMSGSKGSGAGIGIGGLGPGERGGLKEVGKEGFVLAVERRGWVIVLVYEPVSVFHPSILIHSFVHSFFHSFIHCKGKRKTVRSQGGYWSIPAWSERKSWDVDKHSIGNSFTPGLPNGVQPQVFRSLARLLA